MRTESPFPREDAGAAVLRHGLAILLLFTAWAWAGLRPSLQVAGVAVAAVVLAILATRMGRRLMRDPWWWCGCLFLSHLTLQAANSGREQYFDLGSGMWTLARSCWPGWPWSFERAEALQVLEWFFPAWVIGLAVRSEAIDRRSLSALLAGTAMGAGALAVFGFAQMALGWTAPYGGAALRGDFFASFGYANHAGAFFVLGGALATGLLFREVFARGRPRRGRLLALLFSAVACLAAAVCSLSRAGIVAAAALALFAAVNGWIGGWAALTPAGRLKMGVVTVLLAGMLAGGILDPGHRAVLAQFSPRDTAGEATLAATIRANLDPGDRPMLLRAAWSMWNGHRWFGVGAWGFRHLVGWHVPADEWGQLRYEGKANVHMDALQFLVEFGLVGGLPLAAAAVLLVWPALRALPRAGLFGRLVVAGAALVVLMSLIDLPFRCPAILYLWVAMLAAVPRLAAHRRREELSAGASPP